jgi:hypothetical protein
MANTHFSWLKARSLVAGMANNAQRWGSFLCLSAVLTQVCEPKKEQMLLHTHYLNVSTVKLRRLIESNGKNKSRL